jgi:hypothetical protein
VDLNAGDNSLDLKLIPVGSIAGRVLDADGEPVQLANVQVEGNDGTNPRPLPTIRDDIALAVCGRVSIG